MGLVLPVAAHLLEEEPGKPLVVSAQGVAWEAKVAAHRLEVPRKARADSVVGVVDSVSAKVVSLGVVDLEVLLKALEASVVVPRARVAARLEAALKARVVLVGLQLLTVVLMLAAAREVSLEAPHSEEVL